MAYLCYFNLKVFEWLFHVLDKDYDIIVRQRKFSCCICVRVNFLTIERVCNGVPEFFSDFDVQINSKAVPVIISFGKNKWSNNRA